jgi:putative sterol carrier protein
MATVKELMDHARMMIEQNKEKAIATGGVYKFVLNGDGGGTFVINLKDSLGVTECDGAAQCTMKMSVKDFVDTVEGRVDSRQLFFAGKLRVEGDMGLALKLKKVLVALMK